VRGQRVYFPGKFAGVPAFAKFAAFIIVLAVRPKIIERSLTGDVETVRVARASRSFVQAPAVGWRGVCRGPLVVMTLRLYDDGTVSRACPGRGDVRVDRDSEMLGFGRTCLAIVRRACYTNRPSSDIAVGRPDGLCLATVQTAREDICQRRNSCGTSDVRGFPVNIFIIPRFGIRFEKRYFYTRRPGRALLLDGSLCGAYEHAESPGNEVDASALFVPEKPINGRDCV